MNDVLTIAALCINDATGRLLLVRKRGTLMYMQPGGKIEPGETSAAAARRELQEELGLAVGETELKLMGHWLGPAANEPDTLIDTTVYSCPLTGEPVPAAEIEAMLWLPLEAAAGRTDLAPLLQEFVLPLLMAETAGTGPADPESGSAPGSARS